MSAPDVARATDLVSRLRSYDSKNHRGKYAAICREAADEIERIGGLLKLAKHEHYCGTISDRAEDAETCGSQFCRAMWKAGER